jgi:hypothetical protein
MNSSVEQFLSPGNALIILGHIQSEMCNLAIGHECDAFGNQYLCFSVAYRSTLALRKQQVTQLALRYCLSVQYLSFLLLKRSG